MLQATESEQKMAENPDAGDELLGVTFCLRPVKNEARSVEEGRPIFEDREFVRILCPGDKTNIVFREASPQDKARFRKQYEGFKSGTGEILNGTPLSAWPVLSRAQVEELAYFHVRTVEQLADMPDSAAQGIGPILGLRQKAKDFLAAAKGAAPMEKMRKELEQRDNEIAALRESIRAQGEELAQIRKRQDSRVARR